MACVGSQLGGDQIAFLVVGLNAVREILTEPQKRQSY
jgi:hypothetical protein